MNKSQSRRWYLAKKKQREGPFTAEQLTQMVATGVIQPSDMVLEEGKQKWCRFSEAEIPAQADGKLRAFARVKLLGLSTAVAALVLVFGLWSVGLFGPKPSQPELAQQAKAAGRKDAPGDPQKGEPSLKGGPATVPDAPKTGIGKEGPAASQYKPAPEKIENAGQGQKNPEPRKQARSERLASIRESNKAKLHAIATEIAKLNEELAQLDKLLAARSIRDLSPNEQQRLRMELEKRQVEAKRKESAGQLPSLIVEEDVLVQRRHEWTKERAKALQLLQVAEKKLIEAHQKERKVLVQNPEAGDPSFVEHDGLLYTKDELFHNLFAVPFRYNALSQVTGVVTDVDAKNLDVRYTLLVPEGPGFNPPPTEVRFFTRKLVLSNATDVRLWSKGEALGKRDNRPTKSEKQPEPGAKPVGFPTPAEIMAKQKQGKPAQPKDVFPGGGNPGGFSPAQLQRAKPTADNHGNPIFAEDMIKGYRQGPIESLKRGQEVSVFFNNSDHAIIVVIMRSN